MNLTVSLQGDPELHTYSPASELAMLATVAVVSSVSTPFGPCIVYPREAEHVIVTVSLGATHNVLVVLVIPNLLHPSSALPEIAADALISESATVI